MKIINQTPTEMILKDGDVMSKILGVFFLVFSVAATIGLYYSNNNSPGVVIMFVFLGLFFIVGLGLILFTNTITININQSQLTYSKKSLVKSLNKIYNISDVLRVEVRQSYGWREGRNKNSPSVPVLQHQSVVVLKDGQELPIEHIQSSNVNKGGVLMAGKAQEELIIKSVADFLKVPLQEIAPPPLPTLADLKINL